MKRLSGTGASFARKIAPRSPSGAPMTTERSVVSSEPTMNASAPNEPAVGFQFPLVKNVMGFTSASVKSPCFPTKKIIEKMMSVMSAADARKR